MATNTHCSLDLSSVVRTHIRQLTPPVPADSGVSIVSGTSNVSLTSSIVGTYTYMHTSTCT